MIIECPICESRVDATILAEKDYGPKDGGEPFKVCFLECPVCELTMIGKCEYIEVDDNQWDYMRPTRLWPEPAERFHASIPSLARFSLEEGRICFGAQAYSACAVMCGKALEAICAEHETKSKNLAAGGTEQSVSAVREPVASAS
jgi:hypothetical protein